MADGWVARLGDPHDRRAPRLRIAALVLVGLVVATIIAVAVLAASPKVRGITANGTLCVHTDGRAWTSTETLVPPGEAPFEVEGTWESTSATTAELTTATGQVIPMRTRQPVGDRNEVACAIL